MSKRQLVKKPLVPPADMDEALIKRLDYEDPFNKASIWMHKLMIHRIHDMDAVSQHYIDKCFDFSESEEPISKLFNQEDGRFCDRLRYYCRMIQDYEQGKVPAVSIEQDYRICDMLIRRLLKYGANADLVRAAKREVTALYKIATQPDAAYAEKETYQRHVQDLEHRIVKAFGKISDNFYQIEHAPKKVPTLALATKEDVKDIVHAEVEPVKNKQDAALTALAEANKTVNRIDNRAKNAQRKTKYHYTLDRLNGIHNLWLVAQNDPNVKSGSSRKSSLDAALKFYKKEFNALGVYSTTDLRKALKSWSKRCASKQHWKQSTIVGNNPPSRGNNPPSQGK